MSRVQEESFGVEFAAIAHYLRWRLQAAAVLASQKLAISTFGQNYLELQAIPLRAVNGGTEVIYVSAIALKLANAWKTAVLDIATLIAAHLLPAHKSNHSSKNAAFQNFTVKVVPPGWIYLQLSDIATAAWLQRLAQAPPWVGSEGAEISLRPRVGANAKLFEAQYAHARCCSLLRLAHREGTIELAEPDLQISPHFWRVKAPDPIPWVDSAEKLRLVHPAEGSLIFHLLTLLDDLYCVSRSRPIDAEKFASNLSQVFLTFYSQCRIWGEVNTENPQLAQARLGLILATQSLLHLLLQDLLGVPAPLEL